MSTAYQLNNTFTDDGQCTICGHWDAHQYEVIATRPTGPVCLDCATPDERHAIAAITTLTDDGDRYLAADLPNLTPDQARAWLATCDEPNLASHLTEVYG